MNRSEILDEAKRLTTGDRQAQYGDAAQVYKVVGEMWGAYLLAGINKDGGKLLQPSGVEVETYILMPQTVLTLLALMKIGREASGNHKDDNFVDAAGYVALAGEVASKEE